MAKLCNRSGEPLVESGRCSHCSGKGQASTANDPEMLVSRAKQKSCRNNLSVVPDARQNVPNAPP